MILFLYELAYIFPLYILMLFLGGVLRPEIELGLPLYLFATLMMLGILGFKHIKSKIRFVIPGFFLIVLLSGVLLKRSLDIFEENIIYIVWISVIAVVSYIAANLEMRNSKVRIIGSIIVFLIAVMLMVNRIENVKPAAICIGMIVLECVIEEIQKRWIKEGYTDSKAHLVYVMPFILLVSIAMILIPAPENPYDWRFVYKIVEKAQDIYKTSSSYLSSEKEEFSTIGFSEKGKIPPGVLGKDRDVILLTSNSSCESQIYLTGKIFDEFKDGEWTLSEIEDRNGRCFDTLETVSAVRKGDEDNLSDYIRYVRVKLDYQMFNTEYVFVPLKSDISTERLNQVSFKQRKSNLVADKKLRYGSNYEVNYYRIDKEFEGFKNIINSHETITESDWQKVINQYRLANNEEYSYEEFLKYQNIQYEKYGKPVQVSDEVQEELDSINGVAKTDFEKLKLIEDWLCEFEYSEEPGAIPKRIHDESEFLDYFLIDKKEGFCSHFATAFVLLARAEGYPARYVQGYAVVPEVDGTTMVTSDMAHAWPEVYIKNVGWIAFEPTPGYRSDLGWNNENGKGPTLYQNKHVSENKMNNESEDEENAITKLVGIDYRRIMYVIGLFLLFLCIYIYVNNVYAKHVYNKKTNEQKIIALYEKDMRLLNLLGFKIDKGETLEEFLKDLKRNFTNDELHFIEIYEIYIYSKQNVGEAQIDEMTKCQLLLEAKLKQNRKLRYYLYRLSF